MNLVLSGNAESAEELLQELMRTAPLHSDVRLVARQNLAFLRFMQSNYAESVDLLRDCVSERERMLGKDHQLTVEARHQLTHVSQKQIEEQGGDKSCVIL